VTFASDPTPAPNYQPFCYLTVQYKFSNQLANKELCLFEVSLFGITHYVVQGLRPRKHLPLRSFGFELSKHAGFVVLVELGARVRRVIEEVGGRLNGSGVIPGYSLLLCSLG